MTIFRRLRESLPAEVSYALALYGLAACALLLLLLVCQADAKPLKFGSSSARSADLIAQAVIPESGCLGLAGASLLSAHLALRIRRRHSGSKLLIRKKAVPECFAIASAGPAARGIRPVICRISMNTPRVSATAFS